MADRHLLRAFPDSRHSQDIDLPIWIETVPSGAKATVLAGGETYRTPFVLWLHPMQTQSVVLEAEGCEPLRCEIEEKHGEYNLFKLSRRHYRARAVDGPTTCRPR